MSSAKKKRAPAKTPAGSGRKNPGGNSLRVRMYRVGFGDFFLLTVPSPAGPQHILIDCGVHAGNIGSMDDCVKDLMSTTGGKFALVVATHYHADHLSGFASHYADFAKCEVGAVWITNRLDPKDSSTVKFRQQVTSLANRLSLQLKESADDDHEGQQALDKVHNALGLNGGGNAKALQLLTEGFKNKPPVYYYEADDNPTLPDSLKDVLTVKVLGPPPKSAKGAYSASDNRTEQYLAAASEEDPTVANDLNPFGKWMGSASDYPKEVFYPYQTAEQIKHHQRGTAREFEARLHEVQPNALAATADALDGTLNNQSLVLLFTCRGKKLLFVGDAQWGNWEYWLYGKPVMGQAPGITAPAKNILGSIDFYKVGHHGSTNATPIPAAQALNPRCAAMCSTETGFPSAKRTYGSIAKGTEVPRTKLMDALEKQLNGKLVRSDWIAAGSARASPEAHQELDSLPANFSQGEIYIDYVFPE
ncbi:MAG: MBL fold metallo-hydrolase [Proteobacteria bacterium]|nr:MBL fold metallo-hydrolase [Pseudomonadota bacterium]